jgi:hypothetical protein
METLGGLRVTVSLTGTRPDPAGRTLDRSHESPRLRRFSTAWPIIGTNSSSFRVTVSDLGSI